MDVRGRLTAAGKALALAKAGDALAYWLRAQAITVDALQAALDRGDSVLAEALATVPRAEWAAAQSLARPVLASITPADYPAVLQRLAAYADCRPHAHLLYQPHYYHRYFVPAMEQAQAWLAGG